MGKNFVIGDIHSQGEYFSGKNFPEGKTLTEEDVVFQLGDWGLMWSVPATKEEMYWLNFIAGKPFTTVVLLGNHDNHQLVWDLPLEEKFGGWMYADHRKEGTIWYMKTGEVYTINNKTFIGVHGALSIDRAYRIEGESWWATEQLTKADEDNVLDNLDRIDWKVDYLLSHTCPDSVMMAFLDSPNSPKFHDPVSKFLEFIANKLEFDECHFGHFHNSREWVDGSGDYYHCHYTEFHELL